MKALDRLKLLQKGGLVNYGNPSVIQAQRYFGTKEEEAKVDVPTNTYVKPKSKLGKSLEDAYQARLAEAQSGDFTNIKNDKGILTFTHLGKSYRLGEAVKADVSSVDVEDGEPKVEVKEDSLPVTGLPSKGKVDIDAKVSTGSMDLKSKATGTVVSPSAADLLGLDKKGYVPVGGQSNPTGTVDTKVKVTNTSDPVADLIAKNKAILKAEYGVTDAYIDAIGFAPDGGFLNGDIESYNPANLKKTLSTDSDKSKVEDKKVEVGNSDNNTAKVVDLSLTDGFQLRNPNDDNAWGYDKDRVKKLGIDPNEYEKYWMDKQGGKTGSMVKGTDGWFRYKTTAETSEIKTEAGKVDVKGAESIKNGVFITDPKFKDAKEANAAYYAEDAKKNTEWQSQKALRLKRMEGLKEGTTVNTGSGDYVVKPIRGGLDMPINDSNIEVYKKYVDEAVIPQANGSIKLDYKRLWNEGFDAESVKKYYIDKLGYKEWGDGYLGKEAAKTPSTSNTSSIKFQFKETPTTWKGHWTEEEPNYKEKIVAKGRTHVNTPKTIVLHHTATNADSNPFGDKFGAQTGAHALVYTTGERIIPKEKDKDGKDLDTDTRSYFHAGEGSYKTSKGEDISDLINVNSIGVEIVGNTSAYTGQKGHGKFTDKQIQSTAEYAIDKMVKHNIPISDVTSHDITAAGREGGGKQDIHHNEHKRILKAIIDRSYGLPEAKLKELLPGYVIPVGVMPDSKEYEKYQDDYIESVITGQMQRKFEIHPKDWQNIHKIFGGLGRNLRGLNTNPATWGTPKKQQGGQMKSILSGYIQRKQEGGVISNFDSVYDYKKEGDTWKATKKGSDKWFTLTDKYAPAIEKLNAFEAGGFKHTDDVTTKIKELEGKASEAKPKGKDEEEKAKTPDKEPVGDAKTRLTELQKGQPIDAVHKAVAVAKQFREKTDNEMEIKNIWQESAVIEFVHKAFSKLPKSTQESIRTGNKYLDSLESIEENKNKALQEIETKYAPANRKASFGNHVTELAAKRKEAESRSPIHRPMGGTSIMDGWGIRNNPNLLADSSDFKSRYNSIVQPWYSLGDEPTQTYTMASQQAAANLRYLKELEAGTEKGSFTEEDFRIMQAYSPSFERKYPTWSKFPYKAESKQQGGTLSQPNQEEQEEFKLWVGDMMQAGHIKEENLTEEAIPQLFQAYRDMKKKGKWKRKVKPSMMSVMRNGGVFAQKGAVITRKGDPYEYVDLGDGKLGARKIGSSKWIELTSGMAYDAVSKVVNPSSEPILKPEVRTVNDKSSLQSYDMLEAMKQKPKSMFDPMQEKQITAKTVYGGFRDEAADKVFQSAYKATGSIEEAKMLTAQAMLESKWGQSSLAKNNNNWFGIKHVSKGPNAWSSFDDMDSLMRFRLKISPVVPKSNYAEDPNYMAKIKSIMGKIIVAKKGGTLSAYMPQGSMHRYNHKSESLIKSRYGVDVTKKGIPVLSKDCDSGTCKYRQVAEIEGKEVILDKPLVDKIMAHKNSPTKAGEIIYNALKGIE